MRGADYESAPRVIATPVSHPASPAKHESSNLISLEQRSVFDSTSNRKEDSDALVYHPKNHSCHCQNTYRHQNRSDDSKDRCSRIIGKAAQLPKQVLRMPHKYKDAAMMSDIRKNSKI